jgi:hypothetical protein
VVRRLDAIVGAGASLKVEVEVTAKRDTVIVNGEQPVGSPGEPEVHVHVADAHGAPDRVSRHKHVARLEGGFFQIHLDPIERRERPAEAGGLGRR